MRSTTILSVRKDGIMAIGGDGQVTFGDGIMKNNAKKSDYSITIRLLLDLQVPQLMLLLFLSALKANYKNIRVT